VWKVAKREAGLMPHIIRQYEEVRCDCREN